MFGKIGAGELIIILLVTLFVVGPSKLPELGKVVGKSLGEFKKFSNDLKQDLSLEEKKEVKTEAIDKKEEIVNSDQTIKAENDDQTDIPKEV